MNEVHLEGVLVLGSGTHTKNDALRENACACGRSCPPPHPHQGRGQAGSRVTAGRSRKLDMRGASEREGQLSPVFPDRFWSRPVLQTGCCGGQSGPPGPRGKGGCGELRHPRWERQNPTANAPFPGSPDPKHPRAPSRSEGPDVTPEPAPSG